MKIAVTGSYGAGKTTLTKRLTDVLGQRYEPVSPMRDPLQRILKEATEGTRNELVELLIRRLMDRAALEFGRSDVVSDGSLIHDWVFVRTMLMHGARPDERVVSDPAWRIDSIEPARRAVHTRMHGLYDVVVHLPIEFPLSEGHHPISEKFRHLSDDYLLYELACLPVPVITVTGRVDERLARCLSLLVVAENRKAVT